MSIRVLTSKRKKLLTERFLFEIKKESKKNLFLKQRLIVIIPEQFSSYYEEVLAEESGLINIEVMTFSRLVQRLFDLEYVQNQNILSQSGKTMILYSLLNSDELSLNYFKQSAKFPGFSTLLSKTLNELQNNSIGYMDLRDFATKGDSSTIEEKFLELADIYQAFTTHIQEKGYNTEDLAFETLNRQILDSDLFKDAFVWVDRFSYFTSNEFNILKNLAKVVNKINISLCLDANRDSYDSDLFVIAWSTLDEIKGFSEEKKIELSIENISLIDKKEEDLEISTLLENLFLNRPETFDNKVDNISLYKAMDIYEEVEYVAIDIKKRVVEKKERYKDMLLVTSDLDSYEKIALAIFSQYDIPFYVNKRKNITDNPLIKFISTLMDIYIWDYDSSYILKLLKNIYSGYEDEDLIYSLENYIIKWGIKGKRAWHLNWNYENSDKDLFMNKIKDPLIKNLDQFFKKIEKPISAYDFANEFYLLCERFKLSKKLSDSSFFDNLYDYEEAKQCYNSFIKILDQLVYVAPEKENDSYLYLQMLKTAFMEETIGITPMTQDCVFLTDVQRTDIFDYQSLYLLGVNEGAFPGISQPSAIFNEMELEIFENEGYSLFKNLFDNEDEQDYIVYSLLQSSKSDLIITYPSNDFEGNYLFPSPYINKIKGIFPNIKQVHKEDLSTFDYIYNLKSGFSHLKDTKDFLERVEVSENFEKLLDKKEQEKKELDGLGKVLFDTKLSLSPTMLESYIACPYQYLMRYGLKLHEREEFDYFSKNLGNFRHLLLSNALKHIFNEYKDDYTKEELEALCIEYASKINSVNNIYKKDPLMEYIQDRAINQTVETLEATLEVLKTEKIKPLHFEAEFSDKAEFPSITVKDDNMEINLSGKIDRIDRGVDEYSQLFRVIDYKSSSTDISLYQIKDGSKIQLPFYAYAYEKLSDSLPLGFYYMVLDHEFVETKKTEEEDPNKKKISLVGYTFKDDSFEFEGFIDKDILKKRKIVDAHLRDNIFKSLEDNIKSTGKRILESDFVVYPLSDKKYTACEYCPYNSLCGFDRQSRGYRYLTEVKDDEIVW